MKRIFALVSLVLAIAGICMASPAVADNPTITQSGYSTFSYSVSGTMLSGTFTTYWNVYTGAGCYFGLDWARVKMFPAIGYKFHYSKYALDYYTGGIDHHVEDGVSPILSHSLNEADIDESPADSVIVGDNAIVYEDMAPIFHDYYPNDSSYVYVINSVEVALQEFAEVWDVGVASFEFSPPGAVYSTPWGWTYVLGGP